MPQEIAAGRWEMEPKHLPQGEWSGVGVGEIDEESSQIYWAHLERKAGRTAAYRKAQRQP